MQSLSGGRRPKSLLPGSVKMTAMILVITLTIPSLGLAAGIESGIQSGQQAVSGNLRIGFTQSVSSLNPFVGATDASRMFFGLVYDCLQSVDEDGNVVPNLALSWYPVSTSDPNMTGMPFGSIWQYNLTTTAKWSDGVPFTADDVVYAIWLNSPPTIYYGWWFPEPYSYFIRSAWKVDDYTVRISFWNPGTGAPMSCAYTFLTSVPVLPKHLLEKLPGVQSFYHLNWTGVWTESQSPGKPIVSTGPFVVTPDIYGEWLARDHITLIRNPDYHMQGTNGKTVRFEKLTLRFFQDSASMALALKNGEIDVAAFSPSAYRAIQADVLDGVLANVAVFNGPKITESWTEISFCMNNAGPNPSRLDPIIRQALHMATDKDHIIDEYYLGLGDPGTTLIPPISTNWHYEPNSTESAKFAYSLVAAASLLEANGYVDTDGDGTRECTNESPAVQMGLVPEGTKLVYQMLVRKESPEERSVAEFLGDQWSQIGVALYYLVVEELTLSTTAYSYSYDTIIWYRSGDVDPNTQLFVVSSYAIDEWSDCKYSSAEYDSEYLHSVNAMTYSDRKHWVDRAQSIFYNDSAYIILSYSQQGYAWRTDSFTGWGNWSAHPGRSIDNCWSANPLFFDLEPKNKKISALDEPILVIAVASIIVAASAVAAGIALRWRRRPRKPEEPPDSEVSPPPRFQRS